MCIHFDYCSGKRDGSTNFFCAPMMCIVLCMAEKCKSTVDIRKERVNIRQMSKVMKGKWFT